MPPQDCTPLAYILDGLVAAEPGGDKECASSCRLLVAAIAACNHSPDAQLALVAEVGLLDGEGRDWWQETGGWNVSDRGS